MVHHHHRRNVHAEAELAHRAADLVVVGEMVGEGQEPADPLQHLGPDGDGRAEAGIGHAQRLAQHGRRQELIVDRHRRQLRPQSSVVEADIEAADRPHPRRGQGGGDVPQIVGLDHDVGVAEDEDAVPRLGGDIDQVGRLAVDAVDLVVDHEVDGEGGMAGLKVAHHRDRGVIVAMHAEHDLDGAAIVLHAEALERLAQVGMCAVQRLDDGDVRRGDEPSARGDGRRRRPQVARGDAGRGERIADPDERESQERPCQKGDSQAHS